MVKNSMDILGRVEDVEDYDREPRWPAIIAVLAVAGSYTALPNELIAGPRWLFPSVVLALLIPSIVSHHTGRHRLNTIFGFTVDVVLTAGLIISVILLVGALPTMKDPQQLLRLGGSTFGSLIFWFLPYGTGGWTLARPNQRDARAGHCDGDFLFPQMTMTEQALKEAGQEDWSPNFVDYLFLAFNTSTAFSPTDAPVLARWAKVLMMLQSLLSLLIVAL